MVIYSKKMHSFIARKRVKTLLINAIFASLLVMLLSYSVSNLWRVNQEDLGVHLRKRRAALISASNYPANHIIRPLFLFENRELCNTGAEELVLIIVPSRVRDFDKRTVVRQTWANTDSYLYTLSWSYKLVFTVAAPRNELETHIIEIEKEVNQDLVVLNFQDQYEKLTLQVLMSFEWAKQFCSKAKFIYKVDDDTYANLKSIEKYIEPYLQIANDTTENLLGDYHDGLYGGVYMGDSKVLRQTEDGQNFTARWVVTKQEYPSDVYPKYCQGPFYFLTRNLVDRVSSVCPYHCISQTIPIKGPTNCFWKFEDAFIGSCVGSFKPSPRIANMTSVFLDSNYVSFNDSGHSYIALIHPLKNASTVVEMHAFYQLIQPQELIETIDSKNRDLWRLVSRKLIDDDEIKHEKMVIF